MAQNHVRVTAWEFESPPRHHMPEPNERSCLIQLTPILIPDFEMQVNGEHRGIPNPKDLTSGLLDQVQKFVAQECDAFVGWVGKDRVFAGGVEPGYKHVFVVWFTTPPENKQMDDFPLVSNFLRDIYSSCYLGDIGTLLEGQEFSKRCRWETAWK